MACEEAGMGTGGVRRLPQPIALGPHPALACHNFSASVLQAERSKKFLRAGESGFLGLLSPGLQGV